MSTKRGATTDRRRVLAFDVTGVVVHGRGDKLRFEVRCCTKLKSGRYEYVQIDLHACRFSVKHLLTSLKEMHARDREQIAAELARIDSETKALLP